MKKGQMLEGTVERIDYPNKGVVKAEGADRPVVVKNAIPGQKVRVSVNKMRKGRAEGRVLEVLELSPLEIPSPLSPFRAVRGMRLSDPAL